jgi:hypothetical protein
VAPKYRQWKTRNQGFAEHLGHRIYFPGEYNSEASLEAYRAWLARIAADTRPGGLFVAELGERYLDHCGELYGAGHRTAAGAAGLAVRELIHSEWGRLPVARFGPKALAAFQTSLAARGLARATVNGRISWVRRMVRWAVSAELVGADVLRALETVPGLRRGRLGAVESKPREPVGYADVEATANELTPQLRAAVLLQWYTGARSGSIVSARGDQFVPDPLNPELLLWHPRHKTEYRGAVLIIPVGPRAREVIADCLAVIPWRAPIHATSRPAQRQGSRGVFGLELSPGYREGTGPGDSAGYARGTLDAPSTPARAGSCDPRAVRARGRSSRPRARLDCCYANLLGRAARPRPANRTCGGVATRGGKRPGCLTPLMAIPRRGRCGGVRFRSFCIAAGRFSGGSGIVYSRSQIHQFDDKPSVRFCRTTHRCVIKLYATTLGLESTISG